jgi:hypothetical protein
MRGVLPSSDNAEPHAQRYAANLNIEQFHGRRLAGRIQLDRPTLQTFHEMIPLKQTLPGPSSRYEFA